MFCSLLCVVWRLLSDEIYMDRLETKWSLMIFIASHNLLLNFKYNFWIQRLLWTKLVGNRKDLQCEIVRIAPKIYMESFSRVEIVISMMKLLEKSSLPTSGECHWGTYALIILNLVYHLVYANRFEQVSKCSLFC